MVKEEVTQYCPMCQEWAEKYNQLKKQLEAKEQECESLASQLDFEVQKKECLEQECKRLKLDLIEAKAHGDYLNNLALSKTLDTVSAEFDQFKAERDKIKTICDNHFDEYEMGCLELSDAIESLLERYDNAITGLTKQRKELKAENEKLKQYKEVVDKLAGMQVILTNEEKMPMLYENAKDLKLKQLSQTLTEIKDIALKSDMPPCLDTDCECEYCKDSVTNKGFNCMQYGLEQILQKISEVKE